MAEWKERMAGGIAGIIKTEKVPELSISKTSCI